jgi:hypothetical protein
MFLFSAFCDCDRVLIINSPFANSNFAVALDAPVVTVNGEYTLCYIEHIYFYGPS